MLLLYFFRDPGQVSFFPKCPLFAATGLYCMGCGSQRAIHDLLHLDVLGAIKHNVLFVLMLCLLSYHGIIRFMEFKNKKNYPNLLYHPKTPMVVFLVLVLFMIARNIPIHPFNQLAP
ncbi:DUF2752 domain-containing protein [Flavobacteriaceae bacterium 3-367]|uniref:DUF2752 domain-containing protein n=1 Tax=Eudoraea algarum TaxID=3417568 RepID=UPI00327CA6CB